MQFYFLFPGLGSVSNLSLQSSEALSMDTMSLYQRLDELTHKFEQGDISDNEDNIAVMCE